MTVVFYDPTSGDVIQVTTGAEDSIAADGRPYVEVDPTTNLWDGPLKVDLTTKAVSKA